MSYDLLVYTPSDDIICRAALLKSLESKGWKSRIVTDWYSAQIAENGPVANDLIVGWPASSRLAPRIAELFKLQDTDGLDAVFQKDCIASVALGVKSPYQLDTDEAKELSLSSTPDHFETLCKAKTMYWLTTSATRNRLSFQLQEEVWKSIGDLTRGLRENPQAGMPQWMPRHGPIGWLARWLDRRNPRWLD